jgi:hypothetical protein
MIIINYIIYEKTIIREKNTYTLCFQGIHREVTIRMYISNRIINICLRKTVYPSFHFFLYKVIKRENIN